MLTLIDYYSFICSFFWCWVPPPPHVSVSSSDPPPFLALVAVASPDPSPFLALISEVDLPGIVCRYPDPRRRPPCRARFFGLRVFPVLQWIRRQCTQHSIWWCHGLSYVSTHHQARHRVPATGATHQLVDTENEKYKLYEKHKLLCMWCISICIYVYYSMNNINWITSTIISYLPQI